MQPSRLWIILFAAAILAGPTTRLQAQSAGPAAAATLAGPSTGLQNQSTAPAAASILAGPARPQAQSTARAVVPDQPPPNVTSPKYGAWGYDVAGRDQLASAGADFFLYANGNWYRHAFLPTDRTRYGMFDRLVDLADNRATLLIQQAAAGRSSDPDAVKVADAYKAFMDQARADQLDASPLRAQLKAIADEKSRTDVASAMGRAPLSSESSLFELRIAPDTKDTHVYAVYMEVARLGLPDRDYYLDPKFADQKLAYLAYVAQLLQAINWPSPAENAKAVVDFETSIAQVSTPLADERDPVQAYEPIPAPSLNAFAPGFDFRAFLRTAELGGRRTLLLRSKARFPRIAAIFAAAPLDTLRAWQAYHLADNAAPFLSDRFVEARFYFRNRIPAGQPQIQPRWQRAAKFVNDILGEAVGRMYVTAYFTPEAKAKMEVLVENLHAALQNRIERVDWMSPETKAKALQKLATLTVKLGYPPQWRDYSALQISADDLYGDDQRAAAFEWERQVKRIDQPVDKGEWSMTPQTVNAYYSLLSNEVVLPAAMLQPPFFDPDADPAVNYGGIGAVIGHEMTHGFDDQGGKYDGEGALAGWWAPADGDQFVARTKLLGDQYEAFEPVPGAHISGALTMAENVADLGGVLVALDAYHASLGGKPAPVIDGLTGDQRFFLGFAQIWREKIRDNFERQLIVSDPHSPSHYRVVGVVRNVDDWYAAFDIKPTDPMYVPPDRRVRIW
jgi:putative endopeptidase